MPDNAVIELEYHYRTLATEGLRVRDGYSKINEDLDTRTTFAVQQLVTYAQSVGADVSRRTSRWKRSGFSIDMGVAHDVTQAISIAFGAVGGAAALKAAQSMLIAFLKSRSARKVKIKYKGIELTFEGGARPEEAIVAH